VLVLGEHLTVGMVVGFPLILIGSVLAARTRRTRPDDMPDLPAEPAAASVAVCDQPAGRPVSGRELADRPAPR